MLTQTEELILSADKSSLCLWTLILIGSQLLSQPPCWPFPRGIAFSLCCWSFFLFSIAIVFVICHTFFVKQSSSHMSHRGKSYTGMLMIPHFSIWQDWIEKRLGCYSSIYLTLKASPIIAPMEGLACCTLMVILVCFCSIWEVPWVQSIFVKYLGSLPLFVAGWFGQC